MDRSTQMDELDVLKSIYYSEEFQVTDCSEKTEKIQAIFWAYNKLQEDYVIKYLEEPGSHLAYFLKVKHLPPIELRLTFPEDYPSRNPPEFVIHCQWLPKSKISLLCKKLDELWSEFRGMEIIYIWCDFLKNDALNFLGCENELDLRELCSKHLSFLQRHEKGSLLNSNNKKNEENETKENDNCLEEMSSSENHYSNTNSNDVEIKSDPSTSMNLKVENIKFFKDSRNNSRKEFPCNGKKLNGNKNGSCKKGYWKNKFDNRAVLDLNIKTSPLRLLKKYNIEREKVQFLRNYYTCKICFSDKLGKDCTKFQDCNHVFCINCIRSYFTIKIKDGTLQSIKCPEDKCLTEALPSQVKEIVSEELFAKYDTVLLNAALDTLSDIIYCPRQMCQYPVSWEPKEKMASCPNCQYVFCVTCRMVYHGVEPCQFKSVEVRKLIDKYENASADVRSQMESKYGKKHLETWINNAKAESWIKDNSKACPKCEVAIEKSYGCNKMVCWKCNAYFCWLCSTLLDVKNPYEHFKDPDSKCANKLFYLVYDSEDEDDWDWMDDGENDLSDSDFDSADDDSAEAENDSDIFAE